MAFNYDSLSKGDSWYLSLSKLTGKKIKDIGGYITNEFGEPTFKLCFIEFEDGSQLGCEGEHDMPYTVTFAKWPMPEFEANIEAANNEEDGE